MRGARCATRDCQFRDRPREKRAVVEHPRGGPLARGRASRSGITLLAQQEDSLEPLAALAVANVVRSAHSAPTRRLKIKA